MKENFNLDTIFRLIIPGYLAIFVYYTLKSQIPGQTVIPVLALSGIPIGLIFHGLYRFWFKTLGCLSRLLRKDRIYITQHKTILRPGDEGIRLKFKDDFYYTFATDYILDTKYSGKQIWAVVRFLYTQMHSYGAIGTAILGTLLGVWFYDLFVLKINIWDCFYLRMIIIAWVVLSIFFLYLRIEVCQRILWQRRFLIDQNIKGIRNCLQDRLEEYLF